jgi:hypothetical protein
LRLGSRLVNKGYFLVKSNEEVEPVVVVVNAYNPSTWEAEASLGQSRLHSEKLSQKEKEEKGRKEEGKE